LQRAEVGPDGGGEIDIGHYGVPFLGVVSCGVSS
jgi:hypothetical protein